MVAVTCNPRTERWRQEDPWSLLASFLKQSPSSVYTERLSQKTSWEMIGEDTWHQSLASAHVCLHTHTHIHTYSYTHYSVYIYKSLVVTDAGFPAALAGWTLSPEHSTLVDGKSVRAGLEEAEGLFCCCCWFFFLLFVCFVLFFWTLDK